MAIRPPNIHDITLVLNGSPKFLGLITSTSTTDPQSSATAIDIMSNPATALRADLSGKVLLFQADQACHFIGGASATPTITVLAGAAPGPLIGAGERVSMTMTQTDPYLYMVSDSDSQTAKLYVWELL